MGTVTQFSFKLNTCGEKDEKYYKEILQDFIWQEMNEEVEVDVSHDLKD